jgi:glutamate synthase (NADPH/NADH) small chain
MSKLGAFIQTRRVDFSHRDPQERIKDYKEFLQPVDEQELARQGSRCMDCGVPFCHDGCPLGNLIPDWNELVSSGRWREAIDQLHATNNFPEFTGLVCPAPCEAACVLDINDDPVTIKQIELAIINHAFREGWVVPEPPRKRSGKSVGVVGSGPAGMAVAAQLNKAGHQVVVYERDEAVGGLMRFGVPDPKLEKWIIDRRVDILEREGIEFRCNVDVGHDIAGDELQATHDALVIAIGSRVERDLDVPGRELDGIHFAMDYLYQRNRWVAAQAGRPARKAGRVISVADKRVLVIGGGDTGMDCIGNALREGARSAEMLDVYPTPQANGRYPNTPWPMVPKRTLTTYALEEGGQREWSTEVVALSGADGQVQQVHGRKVQGMRPFTPVAGSEFTQEADLVFLAIGFVHPEHEGLLEQLGVQLDPRGNVKAGAFKTSVEGIFAAGDARVGATLIVTAIDEARKCARVVNQFLAGNHHR